MTFSIAKQTGTAGKVALGALALGTTAAAVYGIVELCSSADPTDAVAVTDDGEEEEEPQEEVANEVPAQAEEVDAPEEWDWKSVDSDLWSLGYPSRTLAFGVDAPANATFSTPNLSTLSGALSVDDIFVDEYLHKVHEGGSGRVSTTVVRPEDWRIIQNPSSGEYEFGFELADGTSQSWEKAYLPYSAFQEEVKVFSFDYEFLVDGEIMYGGTYYGDWQKYDAVVERDEWSLGKNGELVWTHEPEAETFPANVPVDVAAVTEIEWAVRPYDVPSLYENILEDSFGRNHTFVRVNRW